MQKVVKVVKENLCITIGKKLKEKTLEIAAEKEMHISEYISYLIRKDLQEKENKERKT